MVTITERAPAKVNLALHVTGRRADGYHLLDSLVVFAEAGDRLTVSPAESDAFTVSGRFGKDLPMDATPSGGNLVLRARDLLRTHLAAEGHDVPPVAIHLEKNLPVASGIGGGSADAAAALRALDRLWEGGCSSETLSGIGLSLGADLPMCLESRPLIARGIGDEITRLSAFPELHILLVNPLVQVATPSIFRALTSRENPPFVPDETGTLDGWLFAIRAGRNDLEPPARSIAPEINDALAELGKTEAEIVRMSGSGATCFGLYRTASSCDAAQSFVETARPGWYCEATRTRSEA